nr:ribonuclease H-like domain-containing protein [Tanacetum cinerariifolium]
MTGDDNHDGDHPETSNPSPPVPPPTQQIPHIISSIKLPILKKGEYDIWAMKMEHYLSHTNYPIWQVKEYQEKDKIGSKPDKKREAWRSQKSQKQLQSVEEEKLNKM